MPPTATMTIAKTVLGYAGRLAAFTLGCAAPVAFAQQPNGTAPPGVAVSVALEQGIVEVTSTQGPLGLYRESAARQAQDFEAFKRQQAEGVRKEQEAFAQYKQQIARDFLGYVDSVTMQAGSELTISGNTAVERQAAPQDNAARDFLKRWRAEGDSPRRPAR